MKWIQPSSFLCSNLEPPGRIGFHLRSIICTNLVEVYKETLHTKYQSSRPSIFREEFWSWSSLFHFGTPWAGPVLTPGASYQQTWLRWTRRCYISNIKALRLPVSEKNNSKVSLPYSYIPTCDPRGGTSFGLRGIICTNLVKVQKRDATYHISKL